MSDKENSQNKSNAPEAGGFQIKDVLVTALKNWYWILLSVAVCIGLASLYLKQTNPVYSRTALLMIKEDSQNGGQMPESFSDMNIFGNRSTLLDEKAMLESPDLMEEVVKRLNLQVSYSGNNLLSKPVLYGSQLPITVSFPEFGPEETASLDVKVNSDGMVDVSNLTVNGREIPTPDHPMAFGTQIKTPSGPVVIEKTPFYHKGQSFDLLVSRGKMSAVRLAYSGKLTVSSSKDRGNVLGLTFHDTSTQRATEILSTLIDVYNESWMADRNQVAVSTSNFINERLNVIEKELGNVDQDISSYKSENLVPDVQAASGLYMQQSSETGNQILALNNQLQMTRYLKEYILKQGNKYQVLPQNSGINNGSIESQIAAFNNTMIQRNSYVENASENHPLVVDIDNRLASMRNGILTSIDNQIMALTTNIRNLQREEQRTTAQIAANPSQARYLLSVERQQKVKESLYLYLLQKREENELSQAFTASNTRVVMRPMGDDVPSSPDKGRIYILAVAIGLAIPFGVIVLREYSNTKVRGRQDLDDLSVPLLGEIPLSRSALKKHSRFSRLRSRKKGTDSNIDGGIVVKEGKRNSINEAFRVLRTNLGFISDHKDDGCETVMISSFNPGSGKTFIAMNLGVSLAIKGKRVLLIDGDLRRTTLSAYVGSPKEGLSNYLVTPSMHVESVICKVEGVNNLNVLPSGSIPPNPTELLESRRFKEMIEDLRGEYDYIIIDCPPVEMMADAQIINTVVDRTIFVVRVGLLERGMLPQLQKLYDEKKYRNLGVIINGTMPDGSRYGYGYGYTYGYGYGSDD